MRKVALFVLIAILSSIVAYLCIEGHRTSRIDSSGAATTSGEISKQISSSPSSASSSKANDAATQSPGSVPQHKGDDSAGATASEPTQSVNRPSLETRRGDLYNLIRNSYSDLLSGWEPADVDPAILKLYVKLDSAETISYLLANLVQPNAAKYEFTHVRFFVPAQPDAVDAWRLDTEATLDADGSWRAYKK